MNCPICGSPYVMGSDLHSACREAMERRRVRDEEIDQMLAWWRARIEEEAE